MKVAGIIAEYNPFHNGHKYHLEKTKELAGVTHTVCVMSGSFVQRGETAIFDKWTRAKAAVKCGADLVLELPAYYVLQNADVFAYGGVKVLNELNFVDYLSFGAENDNINFIEEISKILSEERQEYKNDVNYALSLGQSYPSACEYGVKNALSYKGEDRILTPNNLLGAAYIKSLKRLRSSIKPIAVKRHLVNHNDVTVNQNFASASKIREMIFNKENYKEFLPENINYDIKDMFNPKNIESFILGFLRCRGQESIKNAPGMEVGLDNRIVCCAKNSNSLDELYKSVVSKRYTLSRIRRLIMCAVLGIEKDFQLDYIRVLAFNDKGRELLKKASKVSNLPLVIKTADFTPGKNSMFGFDILATDILSLSCNNPSKRKSGADFTTPPVYVK